MSSGLDSPGASESKPSLESMDAWGFDDADQLRTWVYRENESPSARQQRKDELGHGYLCVISGPINPEIVKQRVGGGVYKLMIHRGDKFHERRLISIAGRPRLLDDADDSEPSVRAPEPAAPPAPALDEEKLVRVITRVMRESAPAPAPSAPPLSFADVLALAKEIGGGRARSESDPLELAKEMHARFTAGRDLGARQGGGGRSIGDAIVESLPALASVLDRGLTAATAMRAAAPAAAVSAPRSEPPHAAPGTPTSTADELVVAGMVANALKREAALAGDPAEQAVALRNFADVLEVQYPEEWLKQLVLVPPAMIAANLRRFEKQLPVLASERLEPFIAQVLELLRASDEDPAADSEAASS